MNAMDVFFSKDDAYRMALSMLYRRSDLVFALNSLQMQGWLSSVRIGKEKAVAVIAESGREVTFRYPNRINLERLVTWNSWPYNQEFVLKGLALVQPYMLVTVKRIVFVQNKQELDALASKSNYAAEIRDYITTSRGTWVNEHQDIVLNIPVIWESVKVIEPDESLQKLPFVILLFDVLLHEVYHAFQYNPLLSMRIAGKSTDEIEDEAGQYVESHLQDMLNELGIIT